MENFHFEMVEQLRPTFPDTIECISDDSVLRGRYELLEKGMKLPADLVGHVLDKCMYVYERCGHPNVFLMYCEAVPELLPADIWETVIADALAQHAEANMSAVVSRTVSEEVTNHVCQDIKRVAIDVSSELVGWLIVSFEQGHMEPLARCIQRIPEDQIRADPTAAPRPPYAQFLPTMWEVRTRRSVCGSAPQWISRGLSPAWVSLTMQRGCFRKDASFNVRPCTMPPLMTKPVPISSKRLSSVRMPTVFESPSKGLLNQSTLSTSYTPRTALSQLSPPPMPMVRSKSLIVVPSTGVVDHTGPSQYVWNLIGSTSALHRCNRDAIGIESMPFATENGQSFILELRPFTESGMISITIGKMPLSSPASRESTIKFKISVGNGKSGLKLLQAATKKFEVILDPRSVFATTPAPQGVARLDGLKKMSVTVEFVRIDRE